MEGKVDDAKKLNQEEREQHAQRKKIIDYIYVLQHYYRCSIYV